MAEDKNIDAEIVRAQSTLFDIEHDIKLLKRKLKKTRTRMYITGDGANLGDPYVARNIISGQLSELGERKAECEERLERLFKQKRKQEEQTNVR